MLRFRGLSSEGETSVATGRKWRIGVIGCGAWGPNHVRNFSALPNAEVVGAADLQPDRLARVKAIAPGIATFADAAAMMAATNPDAVVVSTPTMTHFDVVRQALAAGQARALREAAVPDRRGGRHAGAPGGRTRTAPDGRPRLHVQPGHPQAQRTGEHRRAGQPHLLPVRPPDEPRPDPAGRERRARPGLARRVHLQLPARRGADAGLGGRPVVPPARHPGRGRHHAHLPGRRDRVHPRELARSQEGPRDHRRRRPPDGDVGRPRHAWAR